MLDALVDTLMALWNASWREKVAPAFFAVLVVGISTFLFLMQVGLPNFSRLSSVSGYSNSHPQAGKSVSLAINSHIAGSVKAIAVPTSTQTSTKNSPAPIPAPTQATTYPPTPIPAPMPVQLPGIVSQSGIEGSAYTGTTDIASIDTLPAKSEIHASVRHNTPPHATAPSTPSVVVTPEASTATTTGSTITPTSPSAPTTAATPTLPPTIIVGATPTVVVPTNARTPTVSVPAYPATPISESAPANTVTVSPSLVATDTTGRLQTTTAVSPTVHH